jgi:hypothetical protein
MTLSGKGEGIGVVVVVNACVGGTMKLADDVVGDGSVKREGEC